MNRTQKEQFISTFTEGIQNSPAFALMSFTKLNVDQVTSFRKSLRQQQVRVKVVKNTLAKRALDSTEYGSLAEQLTGPVLVAYGDGEKADVVAAMKAIWKWADDKKFNVEVKGGAALGKVMGVEQLKVLSQLPGREEMLVSFLFALKHHPTRFLFGLKDAPQRLVYALDGLKGKREKE